MTAINELERAWQHGDFQRERAEKAEYERDQALRVLSELRVACINWRTDDGELHPDAEEPFNEASKLLGYNDRTVGVESLRRQVDRLAQAVLEIPGEPREDQGVVDAAIRIIKEAKRLETELLATCDKLKTDRDQAREALVDCNKQLAYSEESTRAAEHERDHLGKATQALHGRITALQVQIERRKGDPLYGAAPSDERIGCERCRVARNQAREALVDCEKRLESLSQLGTRDILELRRQATQATKDAGVMQDLINERGCEIRSLYARCDVASAQIADLEDALHLSRNTIARYHTALDKVNEIRNSIVGAQTINWSEHIYPLVAALDEACIEGLPYPEAKKNLGMMLERLAAAKRKIDQALVLAKSTALSLQAPLAPASAQLLVAALVELLEDEEGDPR